MSKPPFSFQVDLRKPPGTRLGIDVVLVSSPQGCGLVVERVNDGAVEQWNRNNREPMRVHPGDVIIQVNGVQGEISALASALRTAGDVTFIIHRGDESTASPQPLQGVVSQRQGAHPDTQNPEASPYAASMPWAGQRSGHSAPHMPFSDAGVPGYPGRVGLPGDSHSRGMGGGGAGGGGGMRKDSANGPSWGGSGFQYVDVPHQIPVADSWGDQPPLPTRMAFGARAITAGPAAGDDASSHMFGYGGLGGNAPPSPEGNYSQDGFFTFDVVIQKPEGARLGVDVMTQSTEFSGLTVRRISKGSAVDEWNQSQPECFRVMPGDCIVSVNGTSSDFAKMWEELRSRSQRKLRITLRRRGAPNRSPYSQKQSMQPPGPVSLPGRNMQGASGYENLRRMPALTDSTFAGGMNHEAGGAPAVVNLPQQSMLANAGSGGGFADRWGTPGMPGMGAGASNLGSGPTAPRGVAPIMPGSGIAGFLGNFGLPGGEASQLPGPLAASEAVDEPPSDMRLRHGLPQGPGDNALIAGPGAANLGEDVLCFDVLLEPATNNKRIGMDVILVSGNQLCGFVVEQVKDGGRVDRWNKSNPPPFRVQTGDYIIKINGVGTWQTLSKMAEEFAKDNREVCFTIQRGPPGMLQHQGVKKHLQLAAETAAKHQEAVETRTMRKAGAMPPGLVPPETDSTQDADVSGLRGGDIGSNSPPLPTSVPDAPPPMPTGLTGMLATWLELESRATSGQRGPADPALEPPSGLPLPQTDESPAPESLPLHSIPSPPFSQSEQRSTPTDAPAERAAPTEPPPLPGPGSALLAAGPPPGPPPPAPRPASPPPSVPPPAPPGLGGPPGLPHIEEGHSGGDDVAVAPTSGASSMQPPSEPPPSRPSGADAGSPPGLESTMDGGSTEGGPLSSADQVLDTGTLAGPGKGRNSRPVAPIGAGRTRGNGGDVLGVSAAIAVNGMDTAQGAPEALTALSGVRQLNDEDLVHVLKAVLAQKPWLKSRMRQKLQTVRYGG